MLSNRAGVTLLNPFRLSIWVWLGLLAYLGIPGVPERRLPDFEPNKKLVLYSFRHRLHKAMTEAEIPEVLQHRLTGQKLTTHQGYGGDMLDELAKKIPLVKPLG